MTLLQPSYLWGLLALAIPIAIHLWNRKKVRTIKVGSTQFIAETKSNQSNSIQLNEWWLLVLRCAIMSILVFVLCEPHSSTTTNQQDIAYVFEPSLLTSDDGRARFAQIPLEGRRLLMSGFPEWQADDEIIASNKVPNYWQLAQQMEEIPADSIVVFTQAFAKAIRGKRPKVKTNINWIPVDVESEVSKPLAAIVKKDSFEVLSVNSDATRLAFTKTYQPINEVSLNQTKDSVEIKIGNELQSLPYQNQKLIQVTIGYNRTEDTQRIYMEAALRAIRKYTDRDIQLHTVEDSEDLIIDQSDYLIVLSHRSVPETEIPMLIYRPDTLAHKLIELGDTATESFLTRKLTPKIVLEERFAEQVLRWLQLDRELIDKISAFDKRAVSKNQIQTSFSAESNTAKKMVTADMSTTLWIVIFFLLIGERVLARIRKQ
jgi:hypothetical protein